MVTWRFVLSCGAGRGRFGSASTPTKAASASEAAEPDGHDTPGKTRISFLTLGRASGVFRGYAKEPPGAWCSTGGPCDGECGGVLLSHILSGAVPSPCQALASGFGMGSGRLTWAMAAANLQFFFPPLGWGMVPGGGPGTGGWTRCFVVPRFVTMRSLSPGMPHAAVGAW